MFSFFHRKKKVTVDCFTHLGPVFEYTPIVRASKALPDWWKQLPKIRPLKIENGSYKMHTNMKKCYGFTELYKRGAIIENWADTHVEVTAEAYRFHTTVGEVPDRHPQEQYEGGFKNYHHMKLLSPWHMREKSGVPFLVMGTEWNNELLHKVLPGVVEYKNVTGTNVNLMMPRFPYTYEFDLKFGDPLIHIIPLRDDLDVRFKCHLVSLDEIRVMTLFGNVSYGGMRSLKKLEKRNEDRKSKCPF